MPDARDLVGQVYDKGAALQLGPSLHDPDDPVGKFLFNALAMVAEFESDLNRQRTMEGCDRAGTGPPQREAAEAERATHEEVAPGLRGRHRDGWPARRGLQRVASNRVPHDQAREGAGGGFSMTTIYRTIERARKMREESQ